MEIRLPGPYPPAERPKSFKEATQDLRIKAGVHLADMGPFFTEPVEVMSGWLKSAIEDAQTCKLVPTVEDIKVASMAYSRIFTKLLMLEDEEGLSVDAIKSLRDALSEVWEAARTEVIEVLKTKCKCQDRTGE